MAVLALFLVGLSARAEVRYLAAENVLWVSDYLADAPGTPELLARLDRINGWGKVTLDLASGACMVDADLWIGRADGTDTHFQVGSSRHPRETLTVNGNVAIAPYQVPGASRPVAASATPPVNRLTLGSAADKAIQATLRILSAPGQAHTLYCGTLPVAGMAARGPGGELEVYNSTITAAVQDAAHAFGGKDLVQNSGPHIVLYGRARLRQATVSWFRGVATWGLRADLCEVTDTVFEHGDYAMTNNGWSTRGCTFRQLTAALLDWGGPIDTTLVDCVFEGNAANWRLHVPGSRVTLVDGVCAKPTRANECRIGGDGKDVPLARRPVVALRRHVVVEVVDDAGKPVANAVVETTPEQGDWDTVSYGQARTGTDGRTPGPEQGKAILLTERTERASLSPDQPDVTEYSYRITADAPGMARTALTAFRPCTSWAVVRLVLKR